MPRALEMSRSIPFADDFVYTSPSVLPDVFRVRKWTRVFRERQKGRLMLGNLEHTILDMSSDAGFFSWLNEWRMVQDLKPKLVYLRLSEDVFMECTGNVIIFDWGFY